MCDCDDNPAECYSEKTRRSRKTRNCHECWRFIVRGEEYLAVSGRWDGEWGSFSVCAHCEAARVILEAKDKDLCFCLGLMWDGVQDAAEDGDKLADVATARLIVGSKRKWTHRRGPRKGELMPIPVALKAQPVTPGAH